MGANTRTEYQISPDEAVEWLLAMPAALQGVELQSCESDQRVRQLQTLVDAARVAQSALTGLITRVGLIGRANEPASAQQLLQGRARSVRASTARRDAERVEAAASLSHFTEGATQGHIGGDQLDSLARASKRLSDDERQHLNTAELAKAAVDLPADEFDRRVKAAADRARRDHGLADAVAARKHSEFRHWFDPMTGMGKLSGQLDPERYEIVHTALDRMVTSLAAKANEPTRQSEHLAAQALVELVAGSCGPAGSGRAGRTSAAITVVVDEQTLRSGPHDNSIHQTVNGHSVPPETVDRLSCDAVLRRVVLDDRGVPINVGRRYRTATEAQWTAIKAIYANCGWDGCDRPITWCQLHHIHEWERGGPTDLANLLPLCSRHHHQVHEGRWSVHLHDNRSLAIRQPDGTHWTTVPPPNRRPPPVRADPDTSMFRTLSARRPGPPATLGTSAPTTGVESCRPHVVGDPPRPDR